MNETIEYIAAEGLLHSFDLWEGSIRREIEHVASLLGEELSDEPARLIVQVNSVEDKLSRLGYLLCEANAYLEKASFLFLPDKELKELDRKTELNSQLSSIKKMRDYIKILMDGIETRISWSQSILRTYLMTQEQVYKEKR